MKHIKEFKIFTINETMKNIELILYHGGLDGGNKYRKFDKFHNKTSFFADDPKFAKDYAETKGFDVGEDSDRILYTCKFKGKIFDPSNDGDFKKLLSKIDDKTTVHSSNFPASSGEVSREEMIRRLKGIRLIEPKNHIVNAKIGDVVNEKPPEEHFRLYHYDMIVVDKDNENVYTINKENFDKQLRNGIIGEHHLGWYLDYKDVFEPYREALKEWALKTFGERIVKAHKMEGILNTYESIKKSPQYYSSVKLEEEDAKKIDSIYDKCYKIFKDRIYKEANRTKWNIKTVEQNFNNNWNFFESNISNKIKELGYDGYMAKENFEGNIYNSYAIFRPDQTVEIIKKENIN